MSIRYNKNLNSEIQKTIRSFNYRIDKLSGNTDYKGIKLPERLTATELKARVDNRSDLIKTLNAMKRFSRKGALDIVKTASGDRLRYELNELMIQRSQARANLTRKMHFYEQTKVKIAGVSNVASTLSEADYQNYRNFKKRYEALGADLTKLSGREFEAQVGLIKANSLASDIRQMSKFQANMIKAFTSQNAYAGERGRLDQITAQLGKLSPREFWYRYQTSKDFQKLWELYYVKDKDGDNILHAADDKAFERKLDAVVSNSYSIFEEPLD